MLGGQKGWPLRSNALRQPLNVHLEIGIAQRHPSSAVNPEPPGKSELFGHT